MNKVIMKEYPIRIKGILSGILTLGKNEKFKHPVVLLLHGFASQKNEVGNFYVRLANQLATINIATLRFDFSSCGESAGSMKDFSLDTMLEDAKIALDYLMKRPEIDHNNISICGFSLSACIAAHLSIRLKTDIKSLILLSPIGNPKKDFNSILNINIDTLLQQSNNIFDFDLGWRKIILGRQFFESLNRYQPIEDSKNFLGYFLTISGENDFSYQHSLEFMKICSSKEKKFISYKNTDHIFNIFKKK